MANKRRIGWLYLLTLWMLISALAWPAYIVCSTLLANHGAEGWQLDAWHQIPRHELAAHFLHGYKASAIIAVPLGFVAVIDYLLLSRYKATWLFGGILLPVATLIIAHSLYRQPPAAIPALFCTGVVLAVIHRLIDVLAGSASAGRLR